PHRALDAVCGSACLFIFPARAEFYTLSLHDALPIYGSRRCSRSSRCFCSCAARGGRRRCSRPIPAARLPVPTGWNARVVVARSRSEEHTSELQSRENLVCRLLLEQKKAALLRTDSSP